MALYQCPNCGQVNYRYICDYCGVDCVPYAESFEEKGEPKKTEKAVSAHSTENTVKQEKSNFVYDAEKPGLEHWRKIGISSGSGRVPWEFKTAAIIMLCFGIIVLFCCIFERFVG